MSRTAEPAVLGGITVIDTPLIKNEGETTP